METHPFDSKKHVRRRRNQLMSEELISDNLLQTVNGYNSMKVELKKTDGAFEETFDWSG